MKGTIGSGSRVLLMASLFLCFLDAGHSSGRLKHIDRAVETGICGLAREPFTLADLRQESTRSRHIQTIETLFSALANSWEVQEFDTASSVDEELALRQAQVAECFDRYSLRLLRQAKNLPPQDELWNEYLLSHVRMTLLTASVSKSGLDRAISHLGSRIFDRRFTSLIRAANQSLRIYDLLEALKNRPESLEAAKEVATYINDHLSLASLPQTLESFGIAIAQIENSEARHFALKIVLHSIVRKGYAFSRMGIQKEIEDVEETLKHSERAGGYSQEGIQTLRTRLSFLRSNTQGIPFSQPISDLKKGFANVAPGAEAEVDRALHSVRRESEEGFRFKSLHLREGDIELHVGQADLGDSMNSVAGVTNTISHSAVVARERNEGIAYYFVAEMLGGFSKRAIDPNFDTVIFVRPNLWQNRGFSEEAMANLEGKKVRFDGFYRYGQTNSAGEYSLYCSEFIHFFFKTRFRSTSVDDPSPFDEPGAIYHIRNPMARRNLKMFGIPVDDPILIPDHLLFSQNTRTIAVTIPPFGESTNPSRLRLRSDAFTHFNRRLNLLFATREIQPASLWERASSRVKLRMSSFLSKAGKELQFSPDDLDISPISFAYFMRFMDLLEKLETHVNEPDIEAISHLNRQKLLDLFDRELETFAWSMFKPSAPLLEQ